MQVRCGVKGLVSTTRFNFVHLLKWRVGDDVVNEPYIYVIPYPVPDGLNSPEASGGRLQSNGFTGYVLPWESVTSSSNPEIHLGNFLTETSGILKEAMEG